MALSSSHKDDEDEDNDGWGDDKDQDGDGDGDANMTRELTSLRTERDDRRSVRRAGAAEIGASSNGGGDDDDKERDLFIPIFAVVSLLGLFGSYGYEMARLYSRGELYLPWEQ